MSPRRLLFGLIALAFIALIFWMRRVPVGPIVPTGSAPRARGWTADTVLSGLEHPWSVVWLPDGAILLTEKPGRLRLARAGTLAPAPVLDLAALHPEETVVLMDVALHPRFAENALVYLTYGAGTEEAAGTRLARGRLAPDRSSLLDFKVLHTVRPLKPSFQHLGSRLLWLPDETVLLALGDGGNPPVRLGGALMREQAQRLDSQLGKILRLRDDGSAPPDNPFAGRPDADPFVWSYGHRNIQGLARDPASERIWASEHGSRGGDELNLLRPGGNYGWPRATYSIEYTFGTISSTTSRPDMVDPIVAWTPALAPSGLMLYTGDAFPSWRGDLFVGALKKKEIRRVNLDDSGRVLDQQSLPIGARVRDVRQGPDGNIYVLTDETEGRLLRLRPRSG